MAWLPDEQYVLMQDTREKATTARSARHTRTHCGKSGAVKFPSDYLSKKELKAMNGECKSYRMNEPISWKEFKTWPDEHKITYIKLLREKFNAPDTELAKMFGVSSYTVSKCCEGLGLGLGKNGRKRIWDKNRFYDWAYGKCNEAEEVPVKVGSELKTAVDELNDKLRELEEEAVTDELIAVNDEPEISVNEDDTCGCSNVPEPDYTYNFAVPSNGEMTFDGNIDDILRTIGTLLADSKVHIVIKWDVVKNHDEIDPAIRTDLLKKGVAAATYAMLNDERRRALASRG